MAEWQQGQLIELTLEDLSDRGEGVGRWQDRVVFVPDGVPGDRWRVRLTRVKVGYGFGQGVELLTASPQRVRPACIVADKCGGCQWQTVGYEAQVAAKHRQVVEALRRIGGLGEVRVDPVLAAGSPLGYRNKSTYPFGQSAQGRVKAGYYRKGTHQIVNLNQCPIQDDRLNPLLAGVKQSIQARNWSIYSEKTHEGWLRHLSLRIGRHTGQQLLTLVSTEPLPELDHQAQEWLETFPDLVGVSLNLNRAKTNRIFGKETCCVAGQSFLEEQFLGLRFRIQPTTFFQINTEQAERLVQEILTELAFTGHETVLDAYCGIGTLSLPVARQVARCIGLEVQTEAVAQARQNAALNGLSNAEFYVGKVETLLLDLSSEGLSGPGQTLPPIDVVLLDPPRKGCDATVLQALITLKPPRIVYMSCNPATLARDLKLLCGEGPYRLHRVQPADFFPQTAHVECVAFLVA
jgi:23S rRNA (uracil1939-C5)-methyltransferase